MHIHERVPGRHATVVAAAVLCLLFAGRIDGHGLGYSTAASDMVAPLITNPDPQQYVPQPEVMPVPQLITNNPGGQQPELVPDVTPLITRPAADAAADTGAYSQQPNKPAPEGDFYGTATPATTTTTPPETPATDQTGSYGDTPAAIDKQMDADGEPTDGLSPKAIANILKEHNVFRAREHVPPLKWNATVAKYAQQYAEERKGDCALEHSTGPYGENLMHGEGKTWTWKHTVDEWSDEKRSYHYGSNTCDAGKMCGHYTAVVWKDTSDVGCGRVTCSNGDTLMVCSYWPPGNYEGEKPY